MSRKNYKRLAGALHREKPAPNWSPNKHVQWTQDVRAVADALAGDNPRFDREKFTRACETGEGAS